MTETEYNEAEHAQICRQQLSELVSRNTGYLAAYAEQAAAAVPSAAKPVESIVLAYSSSAEMRSANFSRR